MTNYDYQYKKLKRKESTQDITRGNAFNSKKRGGQYTKALFILFLPSVVSGAAVNLLLKSFLLCFLQNPLLDYAKRDKLTIFHHLYHRNQRQTSIINNEGKKESRTLDFTKGNS